MPFQSSDALDDQPVIDGNTTFSGGLVSATRPDNIPATAYADALNMDYDAFGVLESRVGCTSLLGASEDRNHEDITSTHSSLTGVYYGGNLPTDANILSAFYFDTSAQERVVAALTTSGNRRLYFGTPSVAWTQIAGATFDASATYVFFAQLNERLYYCDGASTLAYITAANNNTSIVAGKLSRIDVINQGGNLSAIPSVTIAAPPSGITATAEAVVGNDGNVLSINITNPGSGYTTAPSVTIGGGGGAHAVAYVSLSPPAKPRFLVSHTNRLFCASADTANTPDTLFFSDILDGETWDPAGSVRVGGDGDPITGLFSWFGYKLVVFKERSTWLVDADPTQDPADWTIQVLSGNIGCVSHRSVAAVGADVFFLSRDGVRSLSQIQAGTQTDVGLPLSAPIDDLWSQVNKASLAVCDGIFHGNRYMLSVPLGATQTTANVILVYHALARAWIGRWTGWNVRDFFPTAFAWQGPRLMFAGSVGTNPGGGQVFTFNDYVPNSRTSPAPISTWSDAGNPYQSLVTTRAYNFQEPLSQKTGYTAQVAINNPFTTWSPVVTVGYSADMGATFTPLESGYVIPSPTLRQKHLRAWNLISRGRWNSIQLQVSTNALTGGRLSLHSTVLNAYLDPIRPQQ
jgi:hypothetical protein